ncbi:MAG: hypothetical protein SGI87_08485 [Flavobacteriales bacterium]|nr:hypothetical protein [Flavobacteriales bacterium]
MKLKFILYAFLVLLVASCSTEVELNAPYLKTSIVLGLLDPAADTQWVKINKTFLGEGNNLDYATIRDSSEYEEGEFVATIQEWNDGDLVNTLTLESIELSNKEGNGIFYGPEQTVYFVSTPSGLNEESIYRLNIDFVDKVDVFAETDLVRAQDLIITQPQQDNTILMAQEGAGLNFTYKESVKIRWLAAENVVRYDVTIRFHYTEQLWADLEHTIPVGGPVAKYIDYSVGELEVGTDVLTGSQQEIEFNGESFFATIGSKIPVNAYVTRQVGYFDNFTTRALDFRIAMANEELNTYMNVSDPVTGIVQERPSYTNLANGIGLFASRSLKQLQNVPFRAAGAQNQNANFKALIYGNYTKFHNFCDPNPANTEYSCD